MINPSVEKEKNAGEFSGEVCSDFGSPSPGPVKRSVAGETLLF
jgi:hypothetical protein